MMSEELGYQIGHIALWGGIGLVALFLILFFPLLIARAAKNRGRSGLLWFFLSLMPFVGPITAGFFLLLLGDSKNKWEKDIIKQEQLLEQYHEQRRVIEEKRQAEIELAETRQRLRMERKTEKASANKNHLYDSMQKIAASMDETKSKGPSDVKPSIENDFLKTKTTDHSRFMPH